MRSNVTDYVYKHLAGLKVYAQVPPAAALPIIGTHNGSFHCDEAMACGLLKHTKDYAAAEVLRTRDETQLAQCNVVVDVGGVYDAKCQRFDHHQKEFQGTMTTPSQQYKTRLSSAGLVYQHFGRELIQTYAAHSVAAGTLPAMISEAETDILFDRIYRNFVEQVDGIDNGVNEFSAVPADKPEHIVRNYRTSTSLSARVGSLNPRWNDPPQGADGENAAFARAVTLATAEFFEAVDFYVSSWLPARAIVAEAFEGAASVHPSKQILVFKSGGCPWREHLVDIEEEKGVLGQSLYVMFPDGTGRGWRVQAVPKEASGFENRKSLPWKGLRDDQLSEASGIEGCVFVHASGFIGGNKSYEGALQMAIKALEM